MKETENQQPVKGEEIEMVLEAKGRKAEIVTNPAEKSSNLNLESVDLATWTPPPPTVNFGVALESRSLCGGWGCGVWGEKRM